MHPLELQQPALPLPRTACYHGRMDWGRLARQPRWGVVLAAAAALPACGLVVGWQPRPECDDDCEWLNATGGLGGTGGTASPGSSGGTASGGADSTGTDLGGTASGGTDPGATGSGGDQATSQGSGGSTTSSTQGGGAGGSAPGSGGTSEEGTGGIAATGGTTDSGTGGTAGAAGGPVIPETGESPCRASAIADVADGAYPAQLMLGESQLRAWSLAWLEAGDVYFRPYLPSGSSLIEAAHLLATGTLSAPALATDGTNVAIAFGQATGGGAALNLHYLPANDPPAGTSDQTPSAGSEPPEVGAVLRIGTDRFLTAAVDGSGAGLLSIFHEGVHQVSTTVGSQLESIGLADLGQALGLVVRVESGALSLATLDLDETDLVLSDIEGATFGNPSAGQPVRATSLSGGAALVWVETDGVYASVLDASGAVVRSGRVVDSDTAVLAHVTSYAGEVSVSWLDSASGGLYLRRLAGDLSGGEEPLLVSAGVAGENYGLAVDGLVNVPTYGLVFGTDRLELWQVVCDE